VDDDRLEIKGTLQSSLLGETELALEKLGSSLYESLKKLLRVSTIDEAAVKELIRDLQRALLQADVNVRLVLDLSKRVEERALKEKIPPGVSRREHVIKVVYEELTRFLGEKTVPLKVNPGRRNVFMLVILLLERMIQNMHISMAVNGT